LLVERLRHAGEPEGVHAVNGLLEEHEESLNGERWIGHVRDVGGRGR
jgi:hypothetical protein